MTVRDLVASVVRTAVPAAVGYVLTLLGRKLGVVIDDTTSTSLTAALVVVVGTTYYAVVRILESRWKWLGVLLGFTVQPTYDGKNTSGKL